MVGRFGSREICDVTFKASQEGQKIGTKNFHKGQPVFVIDTATASSMEQATTTVYAQGGKGYNRLIAWEGEKTVTFNVTDALISPLGLAMLTGAGLADASEKALKHIHMTYDIAVDATGKAVLSLAQLNEELGIAAKSLNLCYEDNFKPYATVLDGNGAIVDWVDSKDITITSEGTPTFGGTLLIDDAHNAEISISGVSSKTVKLDFYLAMADKATQVTIAPDSFGGTFYVEADTLYRNQNGQDMAATLTFPKAKIQSGFTLSMSPTGDPSTFDFVMDAMPGYTYFDQTKKVVCDIMIVGNDTEAKNVEEHEEHPIKPDLAVAVAKLATAPTDVNQTECQANQDAISVALNAAGEYEVTVSPDASGDGQDGLWQFTSTDSGQAALGDKEWLGFAIETDEILTNVTWNGTALTSADIAESATVGLNNKTIIFWTPYEKLPKTITLGTVDGSKNDVTIKIVK